jgi:hypothetical protein
MRYFEIAGGFRLDISEEEQTILDSALDGLLEEKLDEREVEVACKMLSRGLLNRLEIDDKVYYVQNGLENIGRF